MNDSNFDLSLKTFMTLDSAKQKLKEHKKYLVKMWTKTEACMFFTCSLQKIKSH